jgi:hypothetical protein
MLMQTLAAIQAEDEQSLVSAGRKMNIASALVAELAVPHLLIHFGLQ